MAQQLPGIRLKLRRDDDFAEDFRDRFSACQIQRLVDGDDAPERRLFIGGKSSVPGFTQVLSLSYAARIGVFEDGERRRVVRELPDQIRRGCQVQNVIERKFLAMQLLEVMGE